MANGIYNEIQWLNWERENRVREARRKARGTVCAHCLRPIAGQRDLDGSMFLYHPDLQDNADDAKNRLGIFCEGRMEATPA